MVKRVAIVVAVLLIHGQAWAQDPISVGDAIRLIGEARASASTSDELGAALEALAEHPEPVVRGTLARLLSEQPALDPGGLSVLLANDTVPSVRLLGLLALSTSFSSDAEAVLAEALRDSEQVVREYAAIALLIRGALAERAQFDPPDEDLLARTQTQIVSDEGRSWLGAIDIYRRLVEAENEWRQMQQDLATLRLGSEAHQLCIELARQNPALIQDALVLDGGTYPFRPMASPSPLFVSPSTTGPAELLVGGQHATLSEVLFALQDATAVGRGFVDSVGTRCDGWDLPAVPDPPPSKEPGATPAELSATFALDLRVSNHPLVFRQALGDFVVGEDIELMFRPYFAAQYLDAAAVARGGEFLRLPFDFADGLRFSATAGGFISSRFFEDRSRPEGSLRFEFDTSSATDGAATGIYSGVRGTAEAGLLSGAEDSFRDLTRHPGSQATALLEIQGYEHDVAGSSSAPQRVLGLSVMGAQHLWNDRASPPREERWLEPAVNGRYTWPLSSSYSVGAAFGSQTRLGSESFDFLGNANWLSFLFGWGDSALRIEGSLGVGSVYSQLSTGMEWTPIGSLWTRFQGRPTDFNELRLRFEVGFERTVSTFGRGGYVGGLDRAEASIGLSFHEEMQDDVQFRLFGERADLEDSGDFVGWGGFEIYIPIDMVGIQQEIGYLMRYYAAENSELFDDRAQEVFEAVLTAGIRF